MDTLAALMRQLGFLSDSLLQNPAGLPLVLVFAAVFVGVLAVGGMLTSTSRAQRRLSQGSPVAVGSTVRGTEQASFWNQRLKTLEKRIGSLSEGERSKLRVRMMQAGYFSVDAPRNYYFIRLALAIALPIVFLVLAPFVTREIPIERVILMTALLSLSGMYAPMLWVSMRISRLQRAVTESFPDALDMLTVCVEAGLGLDAAFTRVGTQIARAHPVLAHQFALVALELRAGKSREDALRNLATRVGIPEVSSFVTLLVQTEALGTSIAQALRVHAEEMRVKRMLRAEEKAHKLPVKMSAVLVLFILPAMVVVLLLPAIIKIIRNLLPALSG